MFLLVCFYKLKSRGIKPISSWTTGLKVRYAFGANWTKCLLVFLSSISAKLLTFENKSFTKVDYREILNKESTLIASNFEKIYYIRCRSLVVGSRRVLHGGSWNNNPVNCRVLPLNRSSSCPLTEAKKCYALETVVSVVNECEDSTVSLT